MSFKIYDAFTEGNVLWQKDDTNVSTDANGVYDIILKDVDLNFSDEYYLGITVNEDNESKPRVNLTSAPYAFRANVSESLDPEERYEVSVLNVTGNLSIGTSSDDVLMVTTGRLNVSDGDLSLGGNLSLSEKITFSLGSIIDNIVSGFLRISSGLNVTGNVTLGGDALFVDNTSGFVGIGTAAPKSKLTVIGDVNITGSLNVSGNITFPQLTNCDTIDTDANGMFTCGSDATGLAPAAVWGKENTTDYLGDGGNGSILRNDTIGAAIDNETINRSIDLTGYLISTTEYSNFQLGNVSNYTEYSRSSDFNLGNISNTTSISRILDGDLLARVGDFDLSNISNVTPWEQITDAPASSNFQLGNVSNNTLVKGDNVSIALWNVSGGNITPSRADSEDGLNLSVPPLFVDIENDGVGIGTTSPEEKLVVIGNVNISGTLNVSGRVAFPNLASCDTIDTDAKGVLSCGSDDSTSGGSVWDLANNDTSAFLTQLSSNITRGDLITPDNTTWVTSSDQVGALTNTYACYTDGSDVLCDDAGFVFITGTNELQIDGPLQLDGNSIESSAAAAISLSNDDVSVIGCLNIGDATECTTQGAINVGTGEAEANADGEGAFGGDVDIDGNLDIEGDIEMSDDDHIGIASNERIIFDTDGNEIEIMGADVGIGTTAPQNTLHVNGTGFLVTNTTGSANVFVFNATTGRIGIGTTAPGRKLEVAGSMNSTELNVSGTTNLAYDSGKVGIGTADPSSTLEVAGNFTVSGDTNSTMGNFSIIQYNSTCSGFRFGATGGLILSCE